MIQLVPLRVQDEARVLAWRNHADVARFMFRDTPITDEEHARWFATALVDSSSSVHRIVVHNGAPIGLSSLTGIDRCAGQCEWGGYLSPDAPRGTGLGREMLEAALSMAFGELGLERCFVEVITTNERAHSLYLAVGFEPVETIRDRVVRSTGPVDVHRLVATRRGGSASPTGDEIDDDVGNTIGTRTVDE